ncbi:MAG TPA: nucleotidyltransferase family protein, partial [Acidobacteriaceae bacterium]|nr:nucleotidyltransferase family protein [Acidobacteriaceae bacterium]
MEPVKPVYAPEFELVLACLRWPQSTVDGARVVTLAQQPIHWPYLLEIVHHQKVVPLFFRNLETFAGEYLPKEPATALRASTEAHTQACLERGPHLQLLNRLFREEAIDVRIFKGIPLSMVAFQDPTLRDLGDIDLLVAERDVFRAGDILRAHGYQRFDPQAYLTPRRLRSYIAHQKDFSYEHPATGVVIDLHWRLFRNQFLPANAGLAEVGMEWVMLDSERIPTLPVSRLLLYLCVHGALDGWLRLKWLADIAALLRSMTAEQL